MKKKIKVEGKSKQVRSKYQEIGDLFRLPGNVKEVTELNDGTHNMTFRVDYSTHKSYIFQSIKIKEGVDINAMVFNADLITNYLRDKNLVSLHFHHTNLKDSFIKTSDGEYWRVLKFFDGEHIDAVQDPDVIYNLGKAIGDFQANLIDFDIKTLSANVPQRHVTREIFANLPKKNFEEYDYLKSVEEDACKVYDLYTEGKIPSRVIHDQTKVSHFIFEKNSKQPLVIIDLDAVKPGISLYDFASGCISCCKDIVYGKKITATFNLRKFECYLDGYFSAMIKILTPLEISLIYDSIYALSNEGAAYNFSRFFVSSNPKRIQKCDAYILLSKDILAKKDQILALVNKYAKKKYPPRLNRVRKRNVSTEILNHEPQYRAGQYMNIYIPHKIKVKKRFGYNFFKRIFDFIASLVALIVLSPVMLLTGILVKMTSKGPMIYVSKRVGKDGRIFNFYKFRSMYIDAESRLEELLANNEVEGGITFKMKNDPRITPFGKFIRKTSLDELPQLINILKGDMSIIGPRVGLPREVRQYPEEALDRLLVPQGLSGEWQANGRSDTSFNNMIRMDLDYVEHKRGFFYDIKLILKTVWVVLRRKGAE